MIKLFGLIPRRRDITPEAFHEHYRHPHGTLALTMSTLEGYVQSHQIHTDLLGRSQSRFEAIAEIWVRGEAEVEGFREEPNLVRHLIPDEPHFIDMANAAFLATAEDEVALDLGSASEADRMWNPDHCPYSIKLIQLIAMGGDSSPFEELSLVTALGVLRHVRCSLVPAFHSDNAEFVAVREFWWPTLSAFRVGTANAPHAWRTLVGDVDRSVSLLARAERYS